ncbi:MAG: hypothetical protein Q9219_001543 [cf. Caloplaca sp. 3 TL-2023]
MARNLQRMLSSFPNPAQHSPTLFAIPFRQIRHSSTVRTLSHRTIPVIKGTTTTTSGCKCDIKFPQGLEIDHSRPLINTVGSHNQHVVIATGKNDWESRIENEEGYGDMAKALKDLTKRTGEWFDPNYSTLISNSSFNLESQYLTGRDLMPHSSQSGSKQSTTASHQEPGQQSGPYKTSTSIKLFPHFLHFPLLENNPTHQHHLVSSYLSDQTSSSSTTPEPPLFFTPPQPITTPTILICSHGTRDKRCGILGPLLYSKFLEHHTTPTNLDVSMISHIGGHAFAGNVIIYIPPDYPLLAHSSEEDKQLSPLAGMGIWYGRVERQHVPVILEETVEKGNIIGELWRGAMDVDANCKDWRSRAASARILRVPSDALGEARDGIDVVEEGNVGVQQVTDADERVAMMGPRARERWKRQQSRSS